MAEIPDVFEHVVDGTTYLVRRPPSSAGPGIEPYWAYEVKGKPEGASNALDFIPGETLDQLRARLTQRLSNPR